MNIEETKSVVNVVSVKLPYHPGLTWRLEFLYLS